MRSQEAFSFPALAADSTDITLDGGLYALAISDVTGTGSFEAQFKQGSSYIATGLKVVGGTTVWVTGNLPPGTYKLALGSTLTADVALVRIPAE